MNANVDFDELDFVELVSNQIYVFEFEINILNYIYFWNLHVISKSIM